ncbi:hypothetical protein ACFWF7_22610 [Nocardia sp. NPDC060256]|uniref:hypothetical protein n=1 Tax=unclassified Nocardia TaxID=2637762 RepID=UPI0036678762
MNDDLMSRSVTGFMAVHSIPDSLAEQTELTLRGATAIEQTHFAQQYLLVSYL